MTDTPDGFNTISKSRISTYRDCPRKFWYKYKKGHRTPGTPATRRGKAVHDEAEAFIKNQIQGLTEPTLLAARQQNLFPEPSQVVMCEVDWSDLEEIRICGLRLNGQADLIYQEGGELVIRDWKTRSDLSADYVPDAVGIMDDLQLNLYTYAASHVFPEVDEFVVEHVNMLRATKGGPETEVVRGRIRREEAFEYVEGLEPTIESMIRTYRKDDIEAVRKNTDSCFKYGGPCHYKGEHREEETCGDDCENDLPEDLYCDNCPVDMSKMDVAVSGFT
jgi:RecB family exonuclease